MPRIARLSLSSLVAAMALAVLPAAADDLIAPGETVKAAGHVAFTEGPAWHPSDNVFFSDVLNNRIMRLDPLGHMHVHRTPSGRANGLLFDLQGRLVCCEGGREGGNRRVTRTERNGTITVLTDAYGGRPYNSPNDLTIDSQGRIYFTDPRYGSRKGMQIVDVAGRRIEGVYRIDRDGEVTRVITHEVDRPNGIAVSADDRWLFVVDNNNSRPDGNRKLWRFDLDDAGNVVPDSRKLLHDFGRGRGGDGMALDVEGRLYVAAGFNVPNPPLETDEVPAGIYVITPEGEQAGFIPVKEDMVTNCAFGGRDRRTLYITAGATLWQVRMKTPGHLAWPPVRGRSGGR